MLDKNAPRSLFAVIKHASNKTIHSEIAIPEKNLNVFSCQNVHNYFQAACSCENWSKRMTVVSETCHVLDWSEKVMVKRKIILSLPFASTALSRSFINFVPGFCFCYN